MAPAAPVMTEAILQKRNASDDSIYDRCYRIRNNTNQVHICNQRFVVFGITMWPTKVKRGNVFLVK